MTPDVIHPPPESRRMIDTDSSSQEPVSPLDRILREVGLAITEQVVLPGRAVRHGAVPKGLHPAVAQHLAVAAPNGLYSHQALALTKFVAGEDLCLGTSTASGKSLIFGAAAAHLLLTEPGSKVLALYPMKALANDQERKWQALAKALDLKIGIIHGGVNIAQRFAILEASDVILATPDVAQSWMLGALPKTMAALARVRMVILDEMASYNGVFASNAAYLFRRLAVHLGKVRWITATATIGNPVEFARSLTARGLTFIGPEEDGSPSEDKRVLLLPENPPGAVALLKALRRSVTGTLLAFADTRKGTEEMSRMVEDTLANPGDFGRPLLPFRAGYEEEDRLGIQAGLASGELCGLICTSALEVGLDLPGVDLVILLNVPPSVQSTLQRIGRIRGGTRGTVLVFDSDGFVHGMGLQKFLRRPAEPNTIYADNPFIMYAHALCAARELQESARKLHELEAIPGWGHGFLQMVANEINPSAPVPESLFPLKQRVANRSPHHEFPLRGAAEPNFQVTLQGGNDARGSLTLAQRLREAAPGMIYGYKGHSYRVIGCKDSSIFVRPEPNRHARTTATLQTMAFPQWSGRVWSDPGDAQAGFVARTAMQISERCVGFSESVGKNTTAQAYGPGSPYSQRPLVRVFPTTGVVISTGQPIPEAVGEFILRAYAHMEGIHARDLGTGPAQAHTGPQGGGAIRGLAIFDACMGGLDLTRRLAEQFETYVQEAIRLAALEGASAASAHDILVAIAARLPNFRPSNIGAATLAGGPPSPASDGWMTGLIAPGEKGLLDDQEVHVLGLFYARDGLKYRLKDPSPTVTLSVIVSAVRPLPGGKTCRYHLDTGEVQPEA